MAGLMRGSGCFQATARAMGMTMATAALPSATATRVRPSPPPPRRRQQQLKHQRRQQQHRRLLPPLQASFDDSGSSSSASSSPPAPSSSAAAATPPLPPSPASASSPQGNGNGFLSPVASATISNNGAGNETEAGAGGDAEAQEDAAAAADYWQDLLNTPEPDMLGARARSASDAGVLRRKGHLKEQDALIDFMRGMHATHSAAEVMAKLDRWVADHRKDPARSRLRRLIPGIGAFFTPLDLSGALEEYDEFFALSRREFVPPNFAELRHVLNIAQVHASAAAGLRLVTFDADGTLYADGAHMQHDNEMIALIIRLLELGVDVAIVTAAGYPGDAARFEQRVHGLLAAFAARRLPRTVTDRFHIMGGECNYLLRAVPPPGFDDASVAVSAVSAVSASPQSDDSGDEASDGEDDLFSSSSDDEGESGSRRGSVSTSSSTSDDPATLRRRRRRRRHLHHASITAEADAAAAAAAAATTAAARAALAPSSSSARPPLAASPPPLPSPHSHRLAFVPDEEWKSPEMSSWTHQDIERLLDSAQRALEEGAARLRLPVRVIRKERAVGVLPLAPTVYEVLEDLAISVQVELAGGKRWEGEKKTTTKESDGDDAPLLPFCAFNGGGDVFVDVGNKSLGLDALKAYLGLLPSQVLHVGDRFTASGNDSATRDCCSILWVANPEETDFFIKLLIADLEDKS